MSKNQYFYHPDETVRHVRERAAKGEAFRTIAGDIGVNEGIVAKWAYGKSRREAGGTIIPRHSRPHPRPNVVLTDEEVIRARLEHYRDGVEIATIYRRDYAERVGYNALYFAVRGVTFRRIPMPDCYSPDMHFLNIDELFWIGYRGKK